MDDEAKAQKLALAKKRVAELKKKKKGTGAGAKKDNAPAEAEASGTAPAAASSPDEAESKPSAPTGDAASASAADDVAVASPTTDTHDGNDGDDDRVDDKGEGEDTPAPLAQGTSLSQRSKARSTSFRKASISVTGAGSEPALFSPEGDTAPDIYRKQVARIEELERENKRLAKDAADADKRWQQVEEELADLREGDGGANKGGGGGGGEVASLKHEIAALQRQNAQLQARTTPSGPRHGSSPSMSLMSPPPTSELEAQLQSRAATIETMELEMSRLRAQVQRLSTPANDGGGPSPTTPVEQQQIAALEDKLARAERAAALAQGELGDLKRNLERASEKAVKEGSERASAETRVRAVEREREELAAARDEAARKADALEKKVATLTTLHREQDGRTQALRKELADLKTRAERAEAEATRLRKKDAAEGGRGAGVDDEGVDELEDEVRQRLERRVRGLEAENLDLRRGIWHERRREMQVGPDGEPAPADGADHQSPFSDVDLGGKQARGRKASGGGGGLGDFLATGLNALTNVAGGGGGGGGHEGGAGHQRNESLGLLEDDDMDFDEDAFRRAQEEEQKRRIERIKEIKRTLKNWEGWRMDVVENRRGGGEGVGEIFEV